MIVVFVILLVLQCASATIVLDCTYSMLDWRDIGIIYICNPRVVQIDETQNVVGVSQNHLVGKTNSDVKGLLFESQPIDFIPRDIELFFGNVEAISFIYCPIKSLTKDDLKPFPNLKFIRIGFGRVTAVNGDVFMYSPELHYIAFDENQLTNVGPGIFQHSPKLNVVFFYNNLCISSSVEYSVEGVARLGQELSFKCPPTVEMIGEIILNGGNFGRTVDGRIESKVGFIDDRMKELEDELEATREQMHKLEEENKLANERFEKFVFNLCAIHGICS